MNNMKTRSVSNSELLPMELVTEVLARLPVKSLVRFRCVCKSWKLFISSSDFASLHLARYHHIGDDDEEENEENTHILQSYWRGGRSSAHSRKWMLRSFRNYEIIKSRYCRFLGKRGFDCPVGYKPLDNSVHGLLLLHSPKSYVIDIMLWNPILGKYNKSPSISIPEVDVCLDLYHTKNDYKVLAIGKEALCSVYVYALSSCTWKRIVDYDISIVRDVCSGGGYQIGNDLFPSAGIQIGDALLWITRESQMVSFDVNVEVFEYIKGKLPSVGLYVRRKLVEYRKLVGLLDVDRLLVRSCSLWVMDKERAQGTWSKLYEVGLEPRCCSDVICFKKSGVFIFTTSACGSSGIELWKCNIETKRMEVLANPKSGPYPDGFFSTLFKESLVLL